MITIQTVSVNDPMTFTVTVQEAGSESTHRVTMTAQTYQDLAHGKAEPESCIEAAFKFLLDREPKESILASFDITLISTYFPEFKQSFSSYLK